MPCPLNRTRQRGHILIHSLYRFSRAGVGSRDKCPLKLRDLLSSSTVESVCHAPAGFLRINFFTNSVNANYSWLVLLPSMWLRTKLENKSYKC